MEIYRLVSGIYDLFDNYHDGVAIQQNCAEAIPREDNMDCVEGGFVI